MNDWVLVGIFALLIRAIVGLGPYSGMGHPPMFGDFEAQRHWMEITLHLPPSDWYVGEHKSNDLSYWGLDYPPLTAFHSLLCARLINSTHPEVLTLHTSRGVETPETKLWMRFLALASDALTFIPAVLLFSSFLGHSPRFSLLVLSSPAFILIDHGHFQFNCICHGLVVLALGLILAPGRLAPPSATLASVLFSLALNFKQMTLYYALGFFVVLLRWAWRTPSLASVAFRLALLASSVLLTFALVWYPFRHNPLAVLGRVFPFERGIFEDKVANFWGVSNSLIKWKLLLSPAQLKFASAAATLLFTLPGLLRLWRRGRGELLSSLFSTSLAFFLFSFQVHEKSILLPLVPAVLSHGDGFLQVGFSLAASGSVFPLLVKDGLGWTWLGGNALFLFAVGDGVFGVGFSDMEWVGLGVGGLGYCLVSALLVGGFTPPERMPDLWLVLHNAYSFVVFCLFYLYSVLYRRGSNGAVLKDKIA